MKGWAKCPSVTPGGQPFFYYKKACDWWVVWSREALCWKVKDRIAALKDGPGFVNQFKTASSAMKAAEQLETKK